MTPVVPSKSIPDSRVKWESKDLLSAKFQHRTPLPTAQTVRFISVPLILSLSARSTGIICLFTPITLYSVLPLLARADKVPQVQNLHELIIE